MKQASNLREAVANLHLQNRGIFRVQLDGTVLPAAETVKMIWPARITAVASNPITEYYAGHNRDERP